MGKAIRREIRVIRHVYPFDGHVIPIGAHGEFRGFTRVPNRIKVKFESGQICRVVVGEDVEIVNDEIRGMLLRRSKPEPDKDEEFD